MADQNDKGGGLQNLGFGLEIAVGIGLGAFVGNWVDRHHGTGPWGLLVGLLLGCAAGMYLLIKEATKNGK